MSVDTGGTMLNRGAVLLRYDADWRIGYGHYSRSCSLAKFLAQRGVSVVHAVKHVHRSVIDALSRAGESVIQVPQRLSFPEEAAFLSERFAAMEIQIAVFDVSTSYTQEAPACELDDYFGTFRQLCPICVIDSVSSQAIVPTTRAEFDVAIVPYVGFTAPAVSNVHLSLSGPEYFVLGPEYCGCDEIRQNREHATRILVTFGGSDPDSTSDQVIRSLDMIEQETFETRIAVGSAFSQALKARLESHRKQSRHSVELIHSPDSLVDHMQWCDMAVANTGLTKYELAATGTPSLQISLDETHAAIHEPFEKLGASRHLGVHTDLDERMLGREILALARNVSARTRMSRNGRNILDGNGGNRVVDALQDLV
jgi:spore coat polysaccharide biosynthesis predicted glycosyltransferase SpsG